MNSVEFYMHTLFLLIPAGIIAVNTAWAQPRIDLITSKDKGSELRLEARQAPLVQVLAKLAQKTQLQINYSVLPEGLVTATCVGSSPQNILECLLARKADLVFRYAQNLAKAAKHQAIEVWILGTKYTLDQAFNSNACLSEPPHQDTGLEQPSLEPEQEVDRTDELLIKAKSNDPVVRVAAISELLSQGRPGDSRVRETLETALTDKDAGVRAQAISSYANREGANAFTALQEALHDSDAWVRQMAVSNTNDKTLLQQAVNDSEESVSSLASQKLIVLREQPGNPQ